MSRKYLQSSDGKLRLWKLTSLRELSSSTVTMSLTTPPGAASFFEVKPLPVCTSHPFGDLAIANHESISLTLLRSREKAEVAKTKRSVSKYGSAVA